jgi:hypothetical protein
MREVMEEHLFDPRIRMQENKPQRFAGAIKRYLCPMEELLNIPVTYQGKELEFEGRFFAYGYIHRIEVNIYGTLLLFEPDEERNYRAILADGQTGKLPEPGLIGAIAAQLESLTQ